MDLKTLNAAVKSARKNIRVLSDKKLNENLGFACGDLAEAYNIGVQEAQMEIVDRLLKLAEKAAIARAPVSAEARKTD